MVIFNYNMRRIFLYIFSFIVASMTMVACSDEITESKQDPVNPSGNVKLNISASPISGTDASTRAAITFPGIDGENIKSWFVVVVDNDRKISQIINSETSYENSDANTTEINDETRYLNITPGTYTFYGFANIPQSDILGNKGVGSTMTANFADTVYNFEGNKPLNVASASSRQTAIDLFPKGIPMTCKKEVTIDNTTGIVTLDLIRMVSKIYLTVRNPTSTTQYIDTISIRHITKDNVDNIKLFPNDKVDEETGARDVNLVSYTDTTKQLIYHYIVPTGLQEDQGGAPDYFTFYVNESHVPDNHPFEVAVSRHTLDSQGNVVRSTLRYNEVTNWFSIGRNEIHMLSANLDRYRIDITAYPYTAIGVMPVYSNDTQMLTLTLNQYGHYDIVPRITDTQTASTYYDLFNTVTDQNVTAKHTVVNGKDTTIYQYDNPGFRIDSVKVTNESSSGWYDHGATEGTQHLPTIGWNSTAMVPRIECITGNYDGSVDVIITAYVTINDASLVTDKTATVPQTIKITRRMRINNRYIDIKSLAKPHR